MIHVPTITLIAYRPSVTHVELGWLMASSDSELSLQMFLWLSEKDKLEAALFKRMKADMTRESWEPKHLYIMLADGRLPTGDLKHDLDSLLTRTLHRAQAG